MTNKIEEIDQNFKQASINGKEYKFFNVAEPPFALDGFGWFEEENAYCRLPQAVAPQINPGVTGLAWCSSGAKVRFKTNSGSIALRAVLRNTPDMSHMPRSGYSGFDLYAGQGRDRLFAQNLKTATVNDDKVEGVFPGDEEHAFCEYMIYFPLYNGVEEVLVGVETNADIKQPAPLSIPNPIVFYGSSITQGGCASRPGNAFTHLLTRWLDADMINLGFSGSGRGETLMAETIAQLDMSAFVMDYDHNAPSLEHLRDTHEPFFNIIREKRPDLPIVVVSKPDIDYSKEMSATRRDIIKKTVDNAVAKGDRNVHFVDGFTLFGETNRDACTVDRCHPNDIGFLRMAEGIYPTLRHALGE